MEPSGAMGVVLGRVRRFGPIPFEDYLDVALYDPEVGFYSTGGAAGRQGDFLTSPELGPLFGAVMARALDAWWSEMGEPDPFVVVEVGAGVGTLAKAVLAAAPRCTPALRYLLVERSESLRQRQPAHVPLEPTSVVLAPRASEDLDDDDSPTPAGDGPRLASLADLPAGPLTGVVLANELLDNLPFTLVERSAGGWEEVRVGEAEGTAALVEVLTPAPPPLAALAAELAPEADPGARIPVQRRAAAWLGEALRLVRRGRVVVVDYAATTSEVAGRPQGQWLRTYRSGGPGGDPLDRPGAQDITCEVCVDQLARVQAPSANRSQAEFLEAHGLAKLVDDARDGWRRGAAGGGLEALRARSRIDEAVALTDPSGLGAFRVLEWVAG
ncbi:MAG: SAM-dependent methyltransferase [Actinobacteria bacterium]|nr:SAM-dependent methyltransferase [Actinomycetota bacterium]